MSAPGCTHVTRTTKADNMIVRLSTGDLLDPEVADMIAHYRFCAPDETDGLTDRELVARVLAFLMSVPRHCAECAGGAS